MNLPSESLSISPALCSQMPGRSMGPEMLTGHFQFQALLCREPLETSPVGPPWDWETVGAV